MKKYKLIKQCKGRLSKIPLGTIITMDETKGQTCYFGTGVTFFPKEVERSENWGKINNRTFNIISLEAIQIPRQIHRVNGEILLSACGFPIMGWSDGKEQVTNVYKILELYPKDWTIHSVQRVSDNEIFTIDDKIKSSVKSDIIITIKRIFFNSIQPSNNLYVEEVVGGKGFSLDYYNENIIKEEKKFFDLEILSINDILEVVDLKENQISKLHDIIQSKKISLAMAK